MTQIQSPDELMSAIPFIVGYKPEKSVVIGVMDDSSVIMAMRFDESLTEHVSDDLVKKLIEKVNEAKNPEVVVIAYIDREELNSPFLNEICGVFDDAGIPVVERIVASNTHYRSTLCNNSSCCPKELPDFKSSSIAASRVLEGERLPFNSEDEMRKYVERREIDTELVTILKSLTGINYNLSEEEVAEQQRDGVIALNTLIAQFKAQQTDRIQKSTVANAITALKDLTIRDYALGTKHKPDFWLWLLRQAPSGYRAPLACLLAVSAYESGEAPVARVALDVAKEDNSNYSMTNLLDGVLRQGINPEMFTAMREELHPKVLKQLGLQS